jgi:crotonobetainyl-CoA:carnitine CoA-transferase CaiB-like acyl-CoA transferase
MTDAQFQALGSITAVDDEELGPIKMQNVMFRLSDTPGQIRWAGRPKGADNDEVYGRVLGLSGDEQRALRDQGVI